MPPHESAHSPRVERIVGWLLRRRIWILALALALGTVAVPRSVLTYAALSSDLEELLPANAPSVEALDALRARLPGMRYLGVVVDTGGPENVPAAIRFLDELAARVEAYPPDLADGVRTGVQEERLFAETYLLQLMEVEDVRRLRRAIEQRRDWEVTHALDLNLLDEEEDPPPRLPIGELRDKYEARYGATDHFYEDRFVDEARQTAVLVVHSTSTSTGAAPDKRLISRVRKDIDELGFPGAYAPGMQLGFAGDVAARVEEMEGLQVDLTTSALIVSLLIVVLVIWFFGSGWALPLLGIPLLLGASYAFGLVALPPWNIRNLNSNTAFLGSIVVGNGVNTGIILLSRVQEERRLGSPLVRAITTGVATTWRPTLAAAGAAAAAYGSLVFTDFRGFNQFGWIGGLGMLSCWLTTVLLGPVLLSFVGDRMPVPRARGGRARGRALLVGLLGRPRWVTGVTFVACVLSVVGIFWRAGTWMEYDFGKLRRRDSFVSGERYWGPRMNQTLGRYLTPTVVLADDADTAALVRERVEQLKETGGAGGLIDSVRTVSDILRPDRAASALEAAKIAELITPRMLQEIEPADRRVVERAVSPAAREPIQPEDLPEVFAAGFRELDGRIDRNVLVFPKLEGETWQSIPIARFTEDLREAATVGSRSFPVAGSLLLSSDITEAMRRDGPRATLVALSVVLIVCLFAFRSRAALSPREEEPTGATEESRQAADRRLARLRKPVWLSIAAIGSILLGVVLMMGAMAWSGERLNFTNFVALPITFGIGADYSINMLRRWQSEGRRDMEGALASTGGAVALCSATTIIGFGSLLVAQNRMLFSFGVLAVAGELACLITAIVVLPTVLRWVGGAGAAGRSA